MSWNVPFLKSQCFTLIYFGNIQLYWPADCSNPRSASPLKMEQKLNLNCSKCTTGHGISGQNYLVTDFCVDPLVWLEYLVDWHPVLCTHIRGSSPDIFPPISSWTWPACPAAGKFLQSVPTPQQGLQFPILNKHAYEYCIIKSQSGLEEGGDTAEEQGVIGWRYLLYVRGEFNGYMGEDCIYMV